jgi:hypothetical protein
MARLTAAKMSDSAAAPYFLSKGNDLQSLKYQSLERWQGLCLMKGLLDPTKIEKGDECRRSKYYPSAAARTVGAALRGRPWFLMVFTKAETSFRESV